MILRLTRMNSLGPAGYVDRVGAGQPAQLHKESPTLPLHLVLCQTRIQITQLLSGVCPVSSWLPLQIRGCKQCFPTCNTGNPLLLLQAPPPLPLPTRTSGSSALRQQTSTQACPTKGKRRSSSRPLNRLQHLAAPMLSYWLPLNTGASQYELKLRSFSC